MLLTTTRVQLALLVLSAAAAISCLRAAASPPSPSSETGDAVLISSFSFPVFNGKANTDGGLVVATNSSILSPATFLFDAQLFPEFNESEGFVLLSQTVELWRTADADAGDGDGSATRDRQASFNTSFTVDVGGSSSVSPVAFVVLLDSFPPLNSKLGLRGTNASAVSAGVAVPNATNSLAAVELGTVSSYGPRSPDVGLNVTITPNRSSPSLVVQIEYDAITHHLWVYVAAAGAGDPRPLNALLNVPLNLAGRLTTQSAFVGFFAATVRDVVVGIRDWELTVDRFPDNGRRDEPKKESTSLSPWLVIPVAVVGSVAAVAAAVVSVVVFFFLSRRRALDMELKQCYSNYFARRL